jgi:hypothetical protein
MVAPEFQIADEITVASYVNQIRTLIEQGAGTNFDIRLDLRSYASIAHNPAVLADSMSFVLLNGRMSPKLRQRIIQTVTDSWMPTSANARASDIEQARMNRARIAVFLTMISPEYLVQR